MRPLGDAGKDPKFKESKTVKTITAQPSVSIEDFDPSEGEQFPEVLGDFTPVQGSVSVTDAGYLINLSLLAPNFTLRKGRMTAANRQYGNPFVLPAVTRNCFKDADTCYRDGNYTPILNTACNDRPFRLELQFQNNQDPNKWGKTTHDISPTCSYSGVVISVG